MPGILLLDVGQQMITVPSAQKQLCFHCTGSYVALCGLQKDFDSTRCLVCGMRYAIGIEEDEDVHRRFHTEKLEGVKFKVWTHHLLLNDNRSLAS